ncbi:hypothetical protein RJ640_002584 [Escallonia rubra]|uniref:Uncharacterized protein n=1 Tax=Escallonia rubra TaxID=112253 RepID=A0AA88QDU3_9ASTE|nr:hypothetical protein RJ640_002584 [Escallonia rubra]
MAILVHPTDKDVYPSYGLVDRLEELFLNWMVRKFIHALKFQTTEAHSYVVIEDSKDMIILKVGMSGPAHFRTAIKLQEDLRANLVRRAISIDYDEELWWDVEDDDDDEEANTIRSCSQSVSSAFFSLWPHDLRGNKLDIFLYICVERVEETGLHLANYCARFNVPFTFNAIAKRWDTIQLEDLKIDRDKIIVVNSLYRLRNVPDKCK